MTTSKNQARDENGRLLPGHTANPNGRPKKGYSITEAFRSMLDAEPEVKAQIVQSIKEKAIAGDAAAQKMVWEYMDGKPAQSVDLSGHMEHGGEIKLSSADKLIAEIDSKLKA